MGRTFRKDNRWKKDRRDQSFRKSKKFKDFQHDHQHRHKPIDGRPIDEESKVGENLENY